MTGDEQRCSELLVELLEEESEFKSRFRDVANRLIRVLNEDMRDPVEAYMVLSFLRDFVKAQRKLRVDLDSHFESEN